MNAACAKYVSRQPKVEIKNCTLGADAARPKPLADCKIDTAMPRRRTK